MEEKLIENMWETVLFFKENLPVWSSLSYHVAGEGKYYSVEGWFENITGLREIKKGGNVVHGYG